MAIFRASLKILLYYTRFSSIDSERGSRGCRFTRENSRKTDVLLSRVSRRNVLGESLSSPLRLVYTPRRSCAFTWIGLKLKGDRARKEERERRERRKEASNEKEVQEWSAEKDRSNRFLGSSRRKPLLR